MAHNTKRRTETEPKGTRSRVGRKDLCWVTSQVNTAENGEKGRPPKRARSRAGRRKGRDSEVNGVNIGRGIWKIHPEGDRNSDTINKVMARSGITVANAGFRPTRKPTKTPTDKTTTLSSGTWDKENRINTKERAATTNQHLGSSSEERVKCVLTVGEKEGAKLGGCRRRIRGKSKIERSGFEVNLKTRDTESRDEKRQETRRRKRKRTESKTSRKDITAETHGGDASHMLEDDGGGGGMTTNKEAETTILKLLKFFEVGSRQLGNGKTILEFRSDKSSVNLGAEQKRKAISINTNMIQKTHDLEDTRGARGNNC